VVGGLAGVKVLQIQKLIAGAKAFAPPPESVSTTVVREEQWQGTLTAIGSITAVQGVSVTPDIPGTVREIAFESGALAAKDDPPGGLAVPVVAAEAKCDGQVPQRT